MTYQPITVNEFEAAFPEQTYGIQTMRDALADVSISTGMDVREIRSPDRRHLVARARQLAMWKSYQDGVTIPMIAQYFKRDTSTVQLSINKIEERMAEYRKAARNTAGEG